MENVYYKINKLAIEENESTVIMTVAEVSNGEAVSLYLNDLMFDKNFIHTSSVPLLVTGDSVIVQKISGIYIITDKLRAAGDKPSVGFELNANGSLSLFSEASIILKTLNAKIDILESGKILIDGNEVYSISKGVNRMQGASIELN